MFPIPESHMQQVVNRRRVFLLGVLLLIAVSTFTLWRRPGSLMWKGKPASYWLARLSDFDLPNSNVSAEEFLFVAGPAVVPELTRGLSLSDSRLYDAWTDVYF